MCYNRINNSEVMTFESWWWLPKILIDLNEVIYRLQRCLGLIGLKSEETLNANFIGDFMSFPKMVETHNFDTR
jgi:hypothetical protein